MHTHIHAPTHSISTHITHIHTPTRRTTRHMRSHKSMHMTYHKPGHTHTHTLLLKDTHLPCPPQAGDPRPTATRQPSRAGRAQGRAAQLPPYASVQSLTSHREEEGKKNTRHQGKVKVIGVWKGVLFPLTWRTYANSLFAGVCCHRQSRPFFSPD